MAKSIFINNKVIVIDKIRFSTVIRRINIDEVNCSATRFLRNSDRIIEKK